MRSSSEALHPSTESWNLSSTKTKKKIKMKPPQLIQKWWITTEMIFEWSPQNKENTHKHIKYCVPPNRITSPWPKVKSSAQEEAARSRFIDRHCLKNLVQELKRSVELNFDPTWRLLDAVSRVVWSPTLDEAET